MVAEQEQGFDLAKMYLWTKGLESKVNNLLREIDIVKNNLLKKNNELNKEMKMLNDELLELKHDHEKTKEKMGLMIQELKRTAGTEEVDVIKKYLDLWNPLSFVTQRDLERAVENKLMELRNKSK